MRNAGSSDRSGYLLSSPARILALAAAGAGVALAWGSPAAAQESPAGDGRVGERVEAEDVAVDPALFEDLAYRMIGPSRGGRVQAVEGHRAHPYTFYMGATGGGVWKTTDAGGRWRPVTDGYLAAGSIGAIEVADADPGVVYVGTGEVDVRGNASAGRGLYRSTDAGRTWSFAGLRDAGQIGDVATDPRNPDRVYVAALGSAFGPDPERGVYRSTDGGESWERVLFVSDSTGFVDLALNPARPTEIYAAAWSVERKPWALVSGSPEGGLWKSADGGDSWEKLGGGLPTGRVGKIGVDVSRADPDRVWAIVEAPRPEGAVYRSDDAGRRWTRVNDSAELQQRPFYYHHIVAHPTDPHTVFVIGESFWVSHDDGQTFASIPVPHGDNHGLWINPERPEIMVEANDGGANVTLDGGASWSSIENQPTAQFYRLEVDEEFPYRVYGAQQDNSTISVPAWADRGTTRKELWRAVGGCESGHVAVNPLNPKIVYAGCYHGEIDRWNAATGRADEIIPYPQAQEGQRAADLAYRFQWNAPIEISPHDTAVVYHTSQVVHVTRDGGQSWEVVSPDLTRDDPEKQDFPRGTVTRDLTGVEVYNTIFALEESRREVGLLWAGTDDGLVWLRRGPEAEWKDVTPPGLPAWSTVNAIDLSAHRPGTAYVTAYRYRMNDFRPYVFRTEDYGETWTRIADGSRGIPPDFPVRVVREDPERQGLLFAGTEFGMYVSFDHGARWQPLQQNLPVVPVTDLRVHRGDLVVATQGRSFWILDDIGPLRELAERFQANAGAGPGAAGALPTDRYLFGPRDPYLVEVRCFRGPAAPGCPPEGVILDYWLGEAPDGPLVLEIVDAGGEVMRRFTSDTARLRALEERWGEAPGPWSDEPLPATAGHHRVTWELEGPDVDQVPGSVVWGSLGGPSVPPGRYTARLAGLGAGGSAGAGGPDGGREAAGADAAGPVSPAPDDPAPAWTLERTFEARIDPRLPEHGVSPANLRERYELAAAIRDTLNALYNLVRAVRDLRDQIEAVTARVPGALADTAGAASLDARAARLVTGLDELERELTQTRSEATFDMAHFPPMLDTEFAYLYRVVRGREDRPTEGARRRWEDLLPVWAAKRGEWAGLVGRAEELNGALREAGMTVVGLSGR